MDWIYVAQDATTYHRNSVMFLKFHSEISPGRIVGSYVVTNGGSGVLLKVVSTSRQVTVALLCSSHSDPRATRIASRIRSLLH